MFSECSGWNPVRRGPSMRIVGNVTIRKDAERRAQSSVLDQLLEPMAGCGNYNHSAQLGIGPRWPLPNINAPSTTASCRATRPPK